MVGGVIVIAVAIALTMARPLGANTHATAAATIGGPAIYLSGNALFNYAVAARVPWSRLAAVLVMVLLSPLALVAPLLVLSTATTVVMLVLAITIGSPARLPLAPG